MLPVLNNVLVCVCLFFLNISFQQFFCQYGFACESVTMKKYKRPVLSLYVTLALFELQRVTLTLLFCFSFRNYFVFQL